MMFAFVFCRMRTTASSTRDASLISSLAVVILVDNRVGFFSIDPNGGCRLTDA
jgi:hypothetical protein